MCMHVCEHLTHAWFRGGGSLELIGFSKGGPWPQKRLQTMARGNVTQGMLSACVDREVKRLLPILPSGQGCGMVLLWGMDGASLGLELFAPLSHDMKTDVRVTASSLTSRVRNHLHLWEPSTNRIIQSWRDREEAGGRESFCSFLFSVWPRRTNCPCKYEHYTNDI